MCSFNLWYFIWLYTQNSDYRTKVFILAVCLMTVFSIQKGVTSLVPTAYTVTPVDTHGSNNKGM